MTIRIVTDSTSDLPEALAASHGITVVPLSIIIGNQSYLDGVELSRQEFYRILAESASIPTTSLPSPSQFVEVYRRLASQGASAILSIHIATSLSKTADAARVAANEVSGLPITVIDSGQLSMGIGFMALAAAEAAEAGSTMDDIVALIEDLGTRTHTFAALSTLKFMLRSGRLTHLQYGLATWLNIKPLLTMHRGQAGLLKVRTTSRAVERLISLATKLMPLEKLALIHTHAADHADALWQRARYLLPEDQEPLSVEVTPVIGTHVGPGAVGFVCVSAKG